jgi:cytidylate kinase
MIVTIDGPAGAGKSTVARRLAERLGFRYVDTGAMYRALTWLALERGVELENETAVIALARASAIAFENGRIEIAGRDVSDEIRSPSVDRSVSTVARHEEVRALMRERQRELADAGDSVLEGRDIGSVVCPHAAVKVFLVANEHERVRRRLAERPDEEPESLAAALRRRDERDAPQTQPAPDAVELDSTGLTVDEVVDQISELVREAR